jgi:acylphosphatase
MPSKRYLVSGRVQRVGFRASARAEAERLGLHGYARNLPDGRVEVLAAGEPSALEALETWLWQGPALARVDEVVVEAAAEVPSEGFSTR